MSFASPNRHGSLWIEWLRLSVENDYLLGVLDPIQSKLEEIYEPVTNERSSDQYDTLNDYADECEHIENLLGVCFVVCQAYIDSVARKLEKIHHFNEIAMQSDDEETRAEAIGLEKALRKLPRQKFEMLRLSEKVSLDIRCSKIEAIHHVGNYFKHRDEWPLDWNKLPKKSWPTRDVITALGLKSNCTGNFREASEVLGNPNYVQVSVLEGIVTEWANLLLIQLTVSLEEMK